MEPDTVQIGSLIFSKVLIDILAPLIGTIIGGLISYLSVMGVENKKIKHEKNKIVQEQKREALKITLNWIIPIYSAISIVRYKSKPYSPSHGDTSGWPNLIKELDKFEVPMHLGFFLPKEIYIKSFEVTKLLDELRHVVDDAKEDHSLEEQSDNSQEIISLLHKISSSFDELKDLIENEYKKTFS